MSWPGLRWFRLIPAVFIDFETECGVSQSVVFVHEMNIDFHRKLIQVCHAMLPKHCQEITILRKRGKFR